MYRRRIASRALVTGAGGPSGRWHTSFVALALCFALLTGCAGVGLQSTGIAGPSWQQREAVRMQEEGDDLGDRVEQAEGEASRKGSRRKTLGVLTFMLGALALLFVLDDSEDAGEELTFEPGPINGEAVPDEPRQYGESWRTQAGLEL